METPDIESAPTPAVKNLLSKFESLAVDQTGSSSRRISLQVPPRPRATSSSNSTTSIDFPGLRSVSSSSSLQSDSGGKRPPPPPPTSSRKGPSPSPTPNSPSIIVPGLPASTNGSEDNLEEGLPPTSGVAALRSKFLYALFGCSLFMLIFPCRNTSSSSIPLTQSPKPTHSPKPSFHSVEKPPPPVPPRLHTPSEPLISFASPEDYHSQSSSSNSTSSLDDPFSEDTARNYPHPPPRHHRHQGSTSSSRTSSESDTGQSIPPPRPPPRPRALAIPVPEIIATDILTPPPLPVRRSTIAQVEDVPSPRTPRPLSRVPPPPPPHNSHPSANHLVHYAQNNNSVSALDPPPVSASAPPSTLSERKPFGKGNLPPPPTRTIALGDKLPAPKRLNNTEGVGDSDEDEYESGEEIEDSKAAGSVGGVSADMLPDTSRASRRPPHLNVNNNNNTSSHTDCRIPVLAHQGHLAISGAYIVVGTAHHVRIWNIHSSMDAPSLDLNTKHLAGLKEAKVTYVEFRSEFLVWVALKDNNHKDKKKEGHLLEIDVRNGDLLGIKHGAHLNPIFYIGRYSSGRGSMVTVDEAGKVLIWSSDDSATATGTLLHNTPRVVRITDKKVDFVKLLGGMLWTAGRTDMHAPGTPSRTPIIRLYDLFGNGSGIMNGSAKVGKAGVGKTVMPTEHVGPVTCATIVPVHPGFVYMGHEEGFITIWNVDGEGDVSPGSAGGFPKCIEVMKVSSSDVTCLEGITNRLWAGGRNGMITAYDIVPRPWIATNSWTAHQNHLPVLHLFADPFGISPPLNQLAVVSIGRDERVCLWDGLLGGDWIDREIQKYEAGYSTFRDLKVLIVTWNCDSAKPDSLYGDPANINFLHDALTSVEDTPDIISFGFQEVIDLESRKMAAKSMLMSSKKEIGASSVGSPMGLGMATATGSATLQGLSDKVTGAYKRWFDALVIAVRLAMPPDCPYSVVHTESMVGLFTCVFVKNAERGSVRDVAINTVKRGMGGRYGNKVCDCLFSCCRN